MSRRQFVGRSALGLSALSAFGLLEACGSDTQTATQTSQAAKPPAKPVGVFKRSYSLEADTLNPGASAAGGLLFISSIYEGLVRYSDDWDKIVPSLATAWTQSDDGREWEFDLRHGVTFHDGEPFDATAVKASFDYFKKENSLAALLLPEFDKVDTSDPQRIRFVLKKPAADFLRSQSFLRIMSPKLIKAGEKAIESQPAGTGAYKFANRTPSRSVTLDANPGYWGSGPYFEHLEYVLMADASARVNALRSGQIDQTNSLAPTSAEQLIGSKSITTLPRQGWRIGYLQFMTTNPNVADSRIRQAIAYSIDRAAIVERVMKGKGKVATSVVPEGIYGHADADQQFSYDPDMARKLLKEAGSGPGHKLRMVVAPQAYVGSAGDAAQAMVGSLKEVGFDATLDLKEFSVMAAEWGKEQPRWDVRYDEHSWLDGGGLIFSINAIQTFTRFKSKAFEDLNAKQQTTPDGPAREKVLADMQNLVQDEAPYVALWVPDQIDAQQSDIEGYTTPPDGITYRYVDTFRAA